MLILAQTTLNTYAQSPTSTIRGLVTDAASGHPIPGASVMIADRLPLLGAPTNTNGLFEINSVPVGRYDIEVRYIGYETTFVYGVVVTSGKVAYIEIAMKEALITGEEVIISADEDRGRAKNSVATVSTRQLRVEEAEKYAGGFSDPARLVSGFAGVASSVANNGIIIRGNTPSGLLWRMEGVEIPAPNHFGEVAGFGNGGITALSSQMLSNSDFMTGAFPAEYGNALSGVFDLSLRNGNNTEQEHTLQAGLMGLDISSEGPLVAESNASYLFNYRYSTLTAIDKFLPSEDVSGIKYQDLAFKINVPGSKYGSFALWGIGLLDNQTNEPIANPEFWEYYYDKQRDEIRIGLGATGLSHTYLIGNRTLLKNTLVATLHDLSAEVSVMNDNSIEKPQDDVYTVNKNLGISSMITHKFSARFNVQAGVNATRMGYVTNLKTSLSDDGILTPISNESGYSFQLQSYAQASFRVAENLTVHTGVHNQHFGLSGKTSVEPRLSAEWMVGSKQTLSFGYGRHSKIEKLNFYLAEIESGSGSIQPNRSLDFTKADHFVLGYTRRLSTHSQIRIEPYYQYLSDVPVSMTGTFSFLNLMDDWFVNEPLVNAGKGRNYGVDLTLERFLNKGWYYLITASIFDSKYKTGDGVWRNTRFNKNRIGNLLLGKEWSVGSSNQHVLNVSSRFTYLGGDRFNPVDVDATFEKQEIVDDESNAFSERGPDRYLLHLSASYRLNRRSFSSVWSINVLNALGDQDYYGHIFNLKHHRIEPDKSRIVIPNLSYKIEF